MSAAGPLLFAGGTALSIQGQMEANAAQARAEYRNAKYLEDQAAFIRDSARREASILKEDREQVKGAQKEAVGASGFTMSGSMLQVLADTDFKTFQELGAIRREARLRENLALSRAEDSRTTARTLGSYDYNIKQAGATLLTNSARMIGMG